MDSLKDILLSKNLDEPTEITALRQYCEETFHITPRIVMKNDALFLNVPNGMLATELRMRTPEIVRRCGITKKLVVRIG